jgi:uncharacterized protein YdhG (YjbR/CyaY superfamily)
VEAGVMSRSRFKTIDEYIAQFPEATRILVYFAAWKNHIGFYPTALGIEAFEKALSTYKYSKGAIQFPLDEPIPFDLVKKIVKYRLQENAAKKKKY